MIQGKKKTCPITGGAPSCWYDIHQVLNINLYLPWLQQLWTCFVRIVGICMEVAICWWYNSVMWKKLYPWQINRFMDDHDLVLKPMVTTGDPPWLKKPPLLSIFPTGKSLRNGDVFFAVMWLLRGFNEFHGGTSSPRGRHIEFTRYIHMLVGADAPFFPYSRLENPSNGPNGLTKS